jgi:hypothetical protein
MSRNLDLGHWDIDSGIRAWCVYTRSPMRSSALAVSKEKDTVAGRIFMAHFARLTVQPRCAFFFFFFFRFHFLSWITRCTFSRLLIFALVALHLFRLGRAVAPETDTCSFVTQMRHNSLSATVYPPTCNPQVCSISAKCTARLYIPHSNPPLCHSARF